MYRYEAKEEIINNPQRYLQPDMASQGKNRIKGYICPFCGSGSGHGSKKKGDGMRVKDGKHFVCWACDNVKNLDVIDIIGKKNGLSEYNDKFRKACEIYGIDYDSLKADPDFIKSSDRIEAGYKKHQEAVKAVKTYNFDDEIGEGSEPAAEPAEQEQEQQAMTDYLDFIKECREHLPECDYLTNRGILPEVQRRHWIGYCADWVNPAITIKPEWGNWRPAPTKRIIIPTSTTSYLARDVRSDAELNDADKEYKKLKVGKVHIFNQTALSKPRPVFVCEGEIDALSVETVTWDEAAQASRVNGVALGSGNNVDIFLKAVERCKGDSPTFYLCADNDEAGRTCIKALIDGLRRLRKAFYPIDLNADYKDINERLTEDAAGLQAAVKGALKHPEDYRPAFLPPAEVEPESAPAAEETEEERQEREQRERCDNSFLSNYVDDFWTDLNTIKGVPYISTGFDALDKELDGGLYAGLYIVGAVPSLGKTALIMQVAEQIAEAGRDVIIFSLEMSRRELMGRSVSRQTMKLALEDGRHYRVDTDDDKTSFAKDYRGVTISEFFKSYSPEEKDHVKKAVEEYRNIADNLSVFVNDDKLLGGTVERYGVKDIEDVVAAHIKHRQGKPVVVVDYLQILASPNDQRNLTEKQIIDENTSRLKCISRNYDIPLICISSYNRSNYNTGAKMESFKESGAIEYDADVLLGLELTGATEGSADDMNEAKGKNPREVDVVVLKNRNGKTSGKISFDFYPAYSHFVETSETVAKSRKARTQKKDGANRPKWGAETWANNIDIAFGTYAEDLNGRKALSLFKMTTEYFKEFSVEAVAKKVKENDNYILETIDGIKYVLEREVFTDAAGADVPFKQEALTDVVGAAESAETSLSVEE